MTTDNATRVRQLRNLGAVAVHEAQGSIGLLDRGIRPLDPAYRLAGPAFTVDIRPGDNLILHYALLKASPGDVLVVDAKGFMEAGHWGELLTAQALKRGLAGLLVHGAVSGGNKLIDARLPVFCRGSVVGTPKHRLSGFNVPVCIGEVVINPGDFVVGDRDGVAIIPGRRVDGVIVSAIHGRTANLTKPLRRLRIN